MALVDEIGFDASFSFVYSKRPGTPAADLADDTPQAVKLERLARLQAAINANAARISTAMVGTVQRILVEGPSKKDAQRTDGAHREQSDREFPRWAERGAARRPTDRRSDYTGAAAFVARCCNPAMTKWR